MRLVLMLILLAFMLWLLVFALPTSGPVHPNREKNNNDEL